VLAVAGDHDRADLGVLPALRGCRKRPQFVVVRVADLGPIERARGLRLGAGQQDGWCRDGSPLRAGGRRPPTSLEGADSPRVAGDRWSRSRGAPAPEASPRSASCTHPQSVVAEVGLRREAATPMAASRAVARATVSVRVLEVGDRIRVCVALGAGVVWNQPSVARTAVGGAGPRCTASDVRPAWHGWPRLARRAARWPKRVNEETA
jgi:hypothetical protein